MNYKLVKDLKDAGFPFKTTNFGPDESIKEALFLDKPYGKGYIPPTLSELIEACDCPIRLWGHEDSWGVDTLNNTKSDGKTPLEAVAKLWLKLNEGIKN